MKQKNSNIELLRMICMFFIIMSHAVLYSDVLSNSEISLNKYIAAIILIGGKYGVNVFFAITAYFLIGKQFHLRRVINVWETTFFYGVLFFILNILVGFRAFELRDICETIFPICYKAYWFATAYVALVLISPFLNFFIQKLDKKALGALVVITACLVTVPVTFLPGAHPYSDESHLLSSILIYLAIGFYKRWIESESERNINLIGGGCIACTGFCWMALSAIFIIVLNKPVLNGYITYWMTGESLPMLMFALGTSVVVFNQPVRSNRFVSFLSAGTFDVYLIHMNHFVYMWLWNKMFCIEEYYRHTWFLIKLIGIGTLIFIICIAVGNVRRMVNDYLNSIINFRVTNKFCEQVDCVLNIPNKKGKE